MDIFEDFLTAITNQKNREIMTNLLNWVHETYPNLEPAFKWNQPMFLDHGTFIIGFSAAKHHFSTAPERKGMIHFNDLLEEMGIDYSKMFIRMKWDQPKHFDLLKQVIEFNILDKKETTSFWRK